MNEAYRENDWVGHEMRYLALADERLTKRAKGMIQALSEQPSKSIPEACENWAATKGAYRFLENEAVEAVQIRAAHYQATGERLAGQPRILVIQDTSELSYTGKEVAEHLGALSNRTSRGVLMHSALAVSVSGVPLGLVHQHFWIRDDDQSGKSHFVRQRETQEKESQRWLDGVQAVEKVVPGEVELIHITDREGDIFDLFALQRQARSQLLIRVTHNRRVEHETGYLLDALSQAPVRGIVRVQVTPQAHREAREAILTVRFLSLTIRPPHKAKGPGVLLQFILAQETQPPPDEAPIQWMLATSLPLNSLEDALTCLHYYALRWLIERFHYVLKSGCRIEQLYLQTPDRLLRALAIYSIVAWRLLWLTYEARHHPNQPCTVILQTHQWQALYCTIHKTATPPAMPPSLSQAVLWIARLGGFLARSHDGFPGPKTIWQGLRRLDDIANTWLLLHPQDNT